MFVVYILRTNKNTLYIGQTNDLSKRIVEHQTSKKGSKYLRAFTSFSVVYTEEHTTRGNALKREYELKQLTKLQKEALILTNHKTQK